MKVNGALKKFGPKIAAFSRIPSDSVGISHQPMKVSGSKISEWK